MCAVVGAGVILAGAPGGVWRLPVCTARPPEDRAAASVDGARAMALGPATAGSGRQEGVAIWSLCGDATGTPTWLH